MIKKNLFFTLVLFNNSKNNGAQFNANTGFTPNQQVVSRIKSPYTGYGSQGLVLQNEELMNDEIRNSTFFRIFTWSEILAVLGIFITAFVAFFSNPLTESLTGLVLNVISATALGLTCTSIMACSLETSCTFVFSFLIFLYSLLLGLFELVGQHLNVPALEDISGSGSQTTVGLIESIFNILGAVLLMLKIVLHTFLVRRNSELLPLQQTNL
jgi:hypothetical protein